MMLKEKFQVSKHERGSTAWGVRVVRYIFFEQCHKNADRLSPPTIAMCILNFNVY